MTCQLFEFYRGKLGDKCLAVADNDDEPSNRIISMYHSQSPPSVKKAVSSSLSDPSGVYQTCVCHTIFKHGDRLPLR